MTASAPRTSNSATACRAAVEPMSPRFASAITGTSDGIDARSRSRAAIPADPNASKNARFGLTAAAYGSGRFEDERREPLQPGDALGEPLGDRRRVRVETEAEHRPGRARARAETLEVRSRSPAAVQGEGLAAGVDPPPDGLSRREQRGRDVPVGSRCRVEPGHLGQVDRLGRPSRPARCHRAWPAAGRRSARRCAGTRWRRRPATRMGAHDASSSVTRSSSLPLPALRMTTSVPSAFVRVAATYRPSGEYDGCM